MGINIVNNMIYNGTIKKLLNMIQYIANVSMKKINVSN